MLNARVRINLFDLVSRVVQDSLVLGGSTRSPRSGQTVEGPGYMVGGFNPEIRVQLGGKSFDEINAEAFGAILAKWDRAKLTRESWLYVGGWVDNGTLYLDTSGKFQDRDRAVEIGVAHNEIAIWDLAKGEEIALNG